MQKCKCSHTAYIYVCVYLCIYIHSKPDSKNIYSLQNTECLTPIKT